MNDWKSPTEPPDQSPSQPSLNEQGRKAMQGVTETQHAIDDKQMYHDQLVAYRAEMQQKGILSEVESTTEEIKQVNSDLYHLVQKKWGIPPS